MLGIFLDVMYQTGFRFLAKLPCEPSEIIPGSYRSGMVKDVAGSSVSLPKLLILLPYRHCLPRHVNVVSSLLGFLVYYALEAQAFLLGLE